MILLYILLGIISYTIIAGLTMRFCLWLDRTITKREPSSDDIKGMTICSALWPFGILFIAGIICLPILFRFVAGRY